MLFIPIGLRQQFVDSLVVLGERLAELAQQVRSSLAWLVGKTIGEAAEAAIRAILGQPTPPEPIYRPPAWGDEDDEDGDPQYRPWDQPDEEPAHQWWDDPGEFRSRPRSTSLWLQRVRQGVQKSWCWFRQQPNQRPLLTALILSGGVGLLALTAGPLLVGLLAGVGVSLASAAVGDAVRATVAWALGQITDQTNASETLSTRYDFSSVLCARIIAHHLTLS